MAAKKKKKTTTPNGDAEQTPPAPAPPARKPDPELLRRTGEGLARALVGRIGAVATEQRLTAALAMVGDAKRIPDAAIDATLGAAIPREWEAEAAIAQLGELRPDDRRLLLAFAAAFYVQGRADSTPA